MALHKLLYVISDNQYDLDNDVISQSGMTFITNSEAEQIDASGDAKNNSVPVYYNHNKQDQIPYGQWVEPQYNTQAPYADAVTGSGQARRSIATLEVFDLKETDSEKTRELKGNAENIGACSIGFTSNDYEPNSKGGFNINSSIIKEVSQTPTPCNTRAIKLGQKSNIIGGKSIAQIRDEKRAADQPIPFEKMVSENKKGCSKTPALDAAKQYLKTLGVSEDEQ